MTEQLLDTVAPAASRARGRILIIEDEVGPRESARLILMDRFAVDTAPDADSGIEAARAQAYSVILLDIKMPGKDGIQALQEIREFDREVSIVILTGNATLETARKSMALGANLYMTKPFDVGELFTTAIRLAKETLLRRKKAFLRRDIARIDEVAASSTDLESDDDSYATAALSLVHHLVEPIESLVGHVTDLFQEVASDIDASPDQQFAFAAAGQSMEKTALRCMNLARVVAHHESAEEDGALELRQIVSDLVDTVFYGTPRVHVVEGPAVLVGRESVGALPLICRLLQIGLEVKRYARIDAAVRREGDSAILRLEWRNIGNEGDSVPEVWAEESSEMRFCHQLADKAGLTLKSGLAEGLPWCEFACSAF